MQMRHFIGVDLGQKKDYTAVAVVERKEELQPGRLPWDGERKTFYDVRCLCRLPLGTTYPEVVREVRELAGGAAIARDCELVVDATGVGAPVLDLLRERDPGCRIVPVTITGGDREAYGDGMYRVPKRDLVVGLQVLFEQGAVRIAAGLRHATTLATELREMRVKVTLDAREKFEAWREGAHDDLVLAVALACWRAKPRGFVGEVGKRLTGM
jgi:hypothetical protein